MEVFPDATFWGLPLYCETVLIGTLKPQRFLLQEIGRRLGEPEVQRDLEESGINGPLELLSYFGLSTAGLHATAGAAGS